MAPVGLYLSQGGDEALESIVPEGEALPLHVDLLLFVHTALYDVIRATKYMYQRDRRTGVILHDTKGTQVVAESLLAPPTVYE